MLRKALCQGLWTRAAHTGLNFDSGWFEKVQHGHDCVCESLIHCLSSSVISNCQLWTESKKGSTPVPSTTIDAKGTLTVTRHSWTRLDAANVLQAVMPVTKGTRYSIAIYSPKRLHALFYADWSTLTESDHIWLSSEQLEVDTPVEWPRIFEFDYASS
eukprot:3044065-Amphidinium_carterae.1